MKYLLLGLLFLSAGVSQGDDLAKAKAEFAKHDKALNETYDALKKELSPELFAQVQEDQRDWIAYRDGMSEWQEREGEPETAVDRWELASGITEERIDWLKAWTKLGEWKGWAGKYSDSRGGLLEIVQEDGKAWFALTVVRGPTFHVGGIGGEFRLNGRMGWFETKPDGAEQPTWLTFLEAYDKPGRITVEGANTSYFHGARAYFDGTYVWMGPLTGKERKAVIEFKRGE